MEKLWVRITSGKHPGAVFFKRAGSHDDFICKFYPGHDAEASLVRAAPQLLKALEEIKRLGWGQPMTNQKHVVGIGGELDQAIANARIAIAAAKEGGGNEDHIPS